MDASDSRSDFRSLCVEAARVGGEVLDRWRGKFNAREKSPGDLVTEADFEAQQAIQQFLEQRTPGFAFLAEEADASDLARLKDEYCWIVDPLDGTVNYAYGLAPYAVSIGLAHSGRIVAGAIWDPLLQEMFSAAVGEGAFCNEQPIKPTACVDLDQALIGVGFAPRISRKHRQIQQFLRVLEDSRGIRRLGSAALTICYVAVGRLDAFWTETVKTWDVAAGIVIAEEAGATVSRVDGQPLDLADPKIVISATPALHERFVELLRTAPAES
jgi:myo-inositol-1(or 4)-monophosphatase